MSDEIKKVPWLAPSGFFLIYILMAVKLDFSLGNFDSSLLVFANVLLVSLVILLFFVCLPSESGRFALFAALLSLPFLLLVAPHYLQSDLNTYASRKFLSVSINSFFLTFFLAFNYQRYGIEMSMRSLCATLLVVLICTVIYKLQFGFMDRTVRYFVNGPIVFGWLMALGALCAFMLASNSRKYYLIAFVFLLGVFWAFSKGPILALSICLVCVLFFIDKNKKGTLITLFSFFVVGLIFVFFAEDVPGLDRVIKVFDSDDFSEISSVKARSEMFFESLRLASHYPFLGVGLGRWADHIYWGDAIYPHNLYVEILSEMGGVVFFLFFLLCIVYFVRSKWMIRVVSLLFAGCLSFSGDLTYAHFLLSSLCVGCALSFLPRFYLENKDSHE